MVSGGSAGAARAGLSSGAAISSEPGQNCLSSGQGDASPRTQRFTVDGSHALELHLEETCEHVRRAIKSLVPANRLDGVVLAGGYGRGEGGVLKTLEGDQPYNDMEFYVFIRGNALLAENAYFRPLHELAKSLSPEAGLDVEFKVLTLEKLRRSPPTMFYYDLVAAHRCILGDESLFEGCEHHREASGIPLHEATRLLFNRCSGLLFSLERLRRPEFGAEESDFVGRNLAKARLAFGDVLLAARGRYHWSCRERHRRLESWDVADQEIQWAERLKPNHARAVEFKLHPERSSDSREVLLHEQAALSSLGLELWLWLESRRLGINMKSPCEYAFSPDNKCPETSSWRNALLNLRIFGGRGLLKFHYPRERLFHALALLLWEPQVLTDARLLGKLRAELQTRAEEFSGLIAAYQDLWTRFN